VNKCAFKIFSNLTPWFVAYFLPKNVGMYFIYLNSREAQLTLKLDQKLVWFLEPVLESELEFTFVKNWTWNWIYSIPFMCGTENEIKKKKKKKKKRLELVLTRGQLEVNCCNLDCHNIFFMILFYSYHIFVIKSFGPESSLIFSGTKTKTGIICFLKNHTQIRDSI